MITAELADGRRLEFPDGTDQTIIQAKVKEMMGIGGEPSPDPNALQIAGNLGPPLGGDEFGIPSPKPSGVGNIAGQIPQVGGGIATGLAGAGTAAAIGGIAGTAALAGVVAVGGAGGEAYKQIGQQLMGHPDAPKSSIEAAQRIGRAGLTEGGYELVGGLAVRGFAKIFAPFKKKMVEGAVSVMDLFDDKIKPMVLLPAEATETRILDILQNISESSLVGGGKMQAFKTNRIKFFDDFADSLIDEFGKRTDPADLGEMFVASIADSRKVHSKAANIMYNSVKAGKVRIPTKSLKIFAKPLQKRSMALGKIEAKNAGDDLMDAIMDLPDSLSYKEANELRSRLLSRVNEFSVINKKAPAIGKANQLIKRLHGSIEKSLKEIPPQTIKPNLRIKLLSEDKGNYFYQLSKKGGNIEGRQPVARYGISFSEDSAYLYQVEVYKGFRGEKIIDDILIDAENKALKKGKKFMTLEPESQELMDMYTRRGYTVDPNLVPEGGMIRSNGGQNFQTGLMIKRLHKPTKEGVEKISPLEAWNNARAFYKEGEAQFNNRLIRRMVKLADDTGTGAEMIAPAIFKPGRVTSIRMVKRAMNADPVTWKKMQGFFMQHLLNKSTNETGDIVGKKLLNNISGKPGSFGMPMLKEILTDAQIESLNTFGKAVKLTQERQAEGAGKVFIQLTQMGAIAGLASGVATIPAATIIIGPAVLK